MDVRLRCECGRFEGRLAFPERAGRAVCYCRDCRSFARFLGKPERIVNERGGSDVIATSPRFVSIDRGREQLRCMSLGPKGLLRWYVACCRTPIGNTPRDPGFSYIGMLHNCFDGAGVDLDATFGPASCAVNTQSATSAVKATPIAAFRAVLKVARNVLGSRLSGKYRDNPFFKPKGSEPVVAPHVLTAAQRRSLQDDA